MDAMSMVLLFIVLYGALVFGSLFLARVAALWKLKLEVCEKLQTNGHLPEPPTDAWHRFKLSAAGFFNWVFNGDLEVLGKGFLELPPGTPMEVVANHSSAYDIFVMPTVLENFKTRYMADIGVMKGFGGLLGMLMAPMGVFLASRKAAIELLIQGESLVIFPEGFTYLDGNMGKFKGGAMNIARLAAEQLGKPVYIVPMFIRYGRYPGSWIRKLPIRLQYLLIALALPYFRRGALVTIGRAIPSTDFPADDHLATDMLRREIEKLDVTRPDVSPVPVG